MGKGSIHPVSVLRSVGKTSNSVTLATAVAKAKGGQGITSPNGVHNPELVRIRVELHNLFTGCSPLDNKAIEGYLQRPSASDRMMIDAWARCGRNDRQRTVSLRLNEVARKTMTPLGLACLISYARAWIDEAEAQEALHAIKGSSSAQPPGDGSKRRQSGPRRTSPARPTARRKSK